MKKILLSVLLILTLVLSSAALVACDDNPEVEPAPQQKSVAVSLSASESLSLGWVGGQATQKLEVSLSESDFREMIPAALTPAITTIEVGFNNATVRMENNQPVFNKPSAATPVRLSSGSATAFYLTDPTGENAFTDLSVTATVTAEDMSGATLNALRVGVFQKSIAGQYLLRGVLSAKAAQDNVAYGTIIEREKITTLLTAASQTTISIGNLAKGDRAEFAVLIWLDASAAQDGSAFDITSIALTFNATKK